MSFFDVHPHLIGVFILVMLAAFPRISVACMLIFGSLLSGGLFWWLGFIFVPHVLVAYLATITYWDTNPILCCIAWFVAFTGTGTETKVVTRNSSNETRQK